LLQAVYLVVRLIENSRNKLLSALLSRSKYCSYSSSAFSGRAKANFTPLLMISIAAEVYPLKQKGTPEPYQPQKRSSQE
jgi:hypothetical protein